MEVSDTCPICYDEIGSSSQLLLGCGHHFHTRCAAQIRPAGDGQKRCPCCRSNMVLPSFIAVSHSSSMEEVD